MVLGQMALEQEARGYSQVFVMAAGAGGCISLSTSSPSLGLGALPSPDRCAFWEGFQVQGRESGPLAPCQDTVWPNRKSVSMSWSFGVPLPVSSPPTSNPLRGKGLSALHLGSSCLLSLSHPLEPSLAKLHSSRDEVPTRRSS